uniref:Pectinesterase inhibitor domain-containing protein n=1 Tax=Graphocephala atropunctata TaxID=36148 RepID=A0A1B6MQW1_9HEMI
MWLIAVLVVVVTLSSAKASNNTSQMCKNDKEQYDAIVNKVATYVSNKIIDQCKHTTKRSKEGQNAEIAKECFRSAANLSVSDLPVELKTELMRLALLEVKFTKSWELVSSNQTSDTIQVGKSLIKNSTEELNKQLRGTINKAISSSGLVDVSDEEAIRPRSSKGTTSIDSDLVYYFDDGYKFDIATELYNTATAQFSILTNWIENL